MSGPLANGVDNKLLIPTIVQTSADLLAFWTNMTCLYDPLWVPEDGRMSLPICMFHITDWHEINTVNISTKRVILYEPQAKLSSPEMAKFVRPSVMRSIVDNAVREPKKYTIEAVLPYSAIDLRMFNMVDVVSGAIDLLKGLIGFDTSLGGITNFVTPLISYSKSLYDAASSYSKLSNINGISMINKNSLDAMVERAHPLVMKVWTGLDYKFVMVSNSDITKKGTEDDMFRVSLQLQETPVLLVNQATGGKTRNPSADPTVWIASKLQKPLSEALITATGVKQFSLPNTSLQGGGL
jgi:hypothetical protein